MEPPNQEEHITPEESITQQTKQKSMTTEESITTEDSITQQTNQASMTQTPEEPTEKKYTLRQKLWHEFRHINRPSEKEMYESFEFFNKSSNVLKKRKAVIDVCGSHGIIGLLFMAFRYAQKVYVIDAYRPPAFDKLMNCWKDFLFPDDVTYVEEDMFIALPQTIELLQSEYRNDEIMVVACHACGHLSDTTINMCIEYGLDFAIMSCCPKDYQKNQIKHAAKTLGISVGAAKDLVTMGRVTQEGYLCYWRTIDESITPENRVLIAIKNHNHDPKAQIQADHDQLIEIYGKRVRKLKSKKYQKTKKEP
eukprot:TRINITY_DN11231_c0_g1_i1.p1 TRINITY_DN11231_c0_g1~~TRINITY_DN11231_c0_g1_i1.p1  ORF type:complete len:308 (+),score=63.75 TRINITY_DN11231_c0_g1_i1:140-1063(+)